MERSFFLKYFPSFSRPSRLSAFSLLEVSITLIVLGVLAAGVMKGRELISQAKFYAVASQVKDYRSAVDVFRSTYGAWPGDFDQASFTFQNAHLPCEDGNGNNVIDGKDEHLFWIHLALADLINLPTSFDVSRIPKFGAGLPDTPVGGGFLVKKDPVEGLKGHWMIMSQSEDGREGILSPREARHILKKIEDINPLSGNAQARDAPNMPGKCVQANGKFTHSDEKSCVLYFKLG